MKRIIVSPLFFLLFLIAPVVIITQLVLHRPLIEPRIVLYNIILLIVYLLALLFVRVVRGRSDLRYGDARPLFRRTLEFPLPASSITTELKSLGYVFDNKAEYGELKDRGYNGGTLFLAGVILTFMTGSYDNLRQLSGTILLSAGEPVRLHDARGYAQLVTGPFSGLERLPYQLRITKQNQPSEQWPEGSTEIGVLDREGKEVEQGTIAPGKPLILDRFRLYAAGFVYEPWIVITTSKNHLVYTGWIKLRHDDTIKDSYRFRGAFQDDVANVEGRAWYDPDSDKLKFEASRDGKKIVDVMLGMGADHRKEKDGYVTTMPGIGKWSEIHFVRKRHPIMLLIGVAAIAAGGVVRLAYRPRRVWIEGKEKGCRVTATDRAMSGIKENAAGRR